MKVRDLMQSEVASCAPGTDLAAAAMIMWDRDCGIVPVVAAGTRKVLGVVTDRDVCMALATTGKAPNQRTVDEVMSRTPFTLRAEESVMDALLLMEREHLRRLPVVDANGSLTGILSINDLIMATRSGWSRTKPHLNPHDVMRALRGICAHRTGAEAETEQLVPVASTLG